jgi:Tol biopolymer transport system component
MQGMRAPCLAWALAWSCAPGAAPLAPAAPLHIAIVASERGDAGARLVVLDEHGDRACELVQPATEVSRDMSPAISPDGRWVVFASSRGRTLDATSLWIARVEPEAVARPLTSGTWIDAHPTWTPDGRAIVFASTRARGNYDLYRMAIDADGRAAAAPVQLTNGDGHEITPTVAPDGTIYYTAITSHPDGTVDSRIERLATDGAIARVTAGPADASPAISPDGHMLAFARPVAHAGGADADLWLVAVDRDGAPGQLADLPLTDEGGPVWSRDGRFVFATSVLRLAERKPVFSSVIVIDTRADKPTARMLEDRGGAIARLTPAVADARLDAAALDANPEYLPEIARITARALAEAQKGEDAR